MTGIYQASWSDTHELPDKLVKPMWVSWGRGSVDNRGYLNNLEYYMAENDKKLEHEWSYEQSMKNWRAWGSWFSWGSPVGLGLFLLALAGTAWILFHLH